VGRESESPYDGAPDRPGFVVYSAIGELGLRKHNGLVLLKDEDQKVEAKKEEMILPEGTEGKDDLSVRLLGGGEKGS